jgi:uncharacterized protein YgiM (DUF1202 family)
MDENEKQNNSQNPYMWLITGLAAGLAVCLVIILVGYVGFIRPRILSSQISSTPIATSTLTPAAGKTQPPNSTAQPTMALTSPPGTVVTVIPGQETLTITTNVNTNCREGPGTTYPILGYLLPGQVSEVEGTDSSNSWWFISNPSDPGGSCWVSSQTTNVKGDTSDLEQIIPPPPPPPGADFYASYAAVEKKCEVVPQVFFLVENTGGIPLESMSMLIVNKDKSYQLYFMPMINTPFKYDTEECYTTINTLDPGRSAYVSGYLEGVGLYGTNAQANIKLCSENSLNGSCTEKIVEFVIPYPDN